MRLRNPLRHVLEAESAAWRSGAVDFGKSLLLLALALLAALYSNTSARSGQAPSAVIGAVTALALALWVTWRFVPRMAAAVEWSWLPSLTRVQITREGWVAVALTVVVGLTAVNTSNNLLYMIFSALLASLCLSLLLAGVNLRSIVVRTGVPSECFARQSFPMTVAISNRKTLFHTFSIRVSPDTKSPFRFAASYFPILGPRATAKVTLETACSRRGRHAIGAIRIESRYPFGLFAKTGRFPVEGECIAFPEITDADTPDCAAPDVLASRERFERGQGMDLYGIRDYEPTDSARRVDWKASAKTAVLKTREFAAEETRRVVIVLDRYGQAGEESGFEVLVSRAASLVVHLTGRGVEVGLSTDEWNSGFGAGHAAGSLATRGPILYYLALVEMSRNAPQARNTQGGETVVLSLRDAASLRDADPLRVSP